MKTWDEYKKHIKNTDTSAQTDLGYAEEQNGELYVYRKRIR